MDINAKVDDSLVIKGSLDTDFGSIGNNNININTMHPSTSNDGVHFGKLGTAVKVENAKILALHGLTTEALRLVILLMPPILVVTITMRNLYTLSNLLALKRQFMLLISRLRTARISLMQFVFLSLLRIRQGWMLQRYIIPIQAQILTVK